MQKWIKLLFLWVARVIPWLFQSWGTPAWALVVGSMTGWAAHSTEWLQPWGNIGIVFCVLGALLVALLVSLMFQYIRRIAQLTNYERKFIERNPGINPLDKSFQNKRIYLAEFALPSWHIIEGKTFVDCEIKGPANIFLDASQATNMPPPVIDAVVLDPSAQFNHGFVFRNCNLHGCSFHRITVFVPASAEQDYRTSAPALNWISKGSVIQKQISFPNVMTKETHE